MPNAVLAALSLRNDDRTPDAAIGVGLLLIGWIVVELAFIRELSFFHPLYVGVGLVLVLLGRRLRGLASAGAEPSTTASPSSVSGGGS